MKPIALAFAAGLVSALGFAPYGLWPLSLVAFAVLIALVERAPRLRSALARGWWFGVGQFALGLNWIATAFTFQAAMPAWLGWIAVGLLSLYLAVYPAAAAGLAWRRFRHQPVAFVLVFAAAWIVTEWLRATLFTGFAWNPIGVMLIDLPIAPLAALVGTYGLSAVVLLTAGLLRLALFRRTWSGALGLGAGLALLQVAALVARPVPAGGEGVPIRIVQPNIGQDLKWSPGFAERSLERLGALSQARRETPALLIWPEAAVTELLQDERRLLPYQAEVRDTQRRVAGAMRPGDLLLTGGITARSRDGRRASEATNSVFAISANAKIHARYDKAHLVPYGEYLPMRPILSALGLSRLAPGDLDFAPGPGPRTLSLPDIGAVGFQLCYEIIFSGQVVDPARRPGFIFNPSNDAWFGAWGPPQHLAQARLRALEEGLPVIRATPTGISAVIDARGRVLHSIPLGRAGIIDARMPRAAPPTAFARAGNVAAFLFALLLVAAAIAVRRKAG
jgi:apolipoprotein N-acyltransferase